ncbi:hypothetical protein [Streptomyces sp. NPDC098781]|uniref:hypothetical protein n=1 Tax=Streptomyces sp. NPDC098781 TaxID=3366097 RepID=UPI00383053EC
MLGTPTGAERTLGRAFASAVAEFVTTGSVRDRLPCAPATAARIRHGRASRTSAKCDDRHMRGLELRRSPCIQSATVTKRPRSDSMAYLRGFIPWIVAGVVTSFDWRWGALGGLVSGLLLLVLERRRGVGLDALILEISSVVYFAVIAVVAVTRPHSVLADHVDVVSFAWLAATAWGTLAIRRPFTVGIAKRQTPREYWEMPEFIRVNNHITSAWGAGFTFIAVSLAVLGAVDAPLWAGITARVAGLVAPAAFTKVYPARAQARLSAAPAPLAAVPQQSPEGADAP